MFMNWPKASQLMLNSARSLVLAAGLAGASAAQSSHMASPHVNADPSSALIEGRVRLPSGQSAELNVKITLSNSTSTLNTLFTNLHGEFRFPDLKEGIYYVLASGNEELYEPVTETVRIGRGQVVQLTIGLRLRPETIKHRAGSNVISATGLKEDAPPAARKEYEQAMKFAGKGQFRQAIDSLRRAIEIHPNYLVAHNDLGAQYLKLGQVEEAAEEFRFVLEKDPTYFNSRFNLGLVMVERNDHLAAQAQFRMAVQTDTSRAVAHFWLGISLLQTGDLQNAERELTRALITGGGSFPAAHYYLGRLYLKRGDREGAMRSYRAYIEEAPHGEYADEVRIWLKKQ